MKRVFSLLIALVMVLGITSAAFAQPFYLEIAGVTIDVPEGMTGQDISTEEVYALGVTVDDDPDVVYTYSLAYIEEYEGLFLADLSDEQAEELGYGIAQSIEAPELAVSQANGYDVLVVANGAGTQLHYISLLNGWLCDVAVVNGAGEVLTDDQITAAAVMLTSINFDAAGVLE